MKNFIYRIVLKISFLQTLRMFVWERIVFLFDDISSKHYIMLLPKPLLIRGRSVWTLCKTNLGKASPPPWRVPVGGRAMTPKVLRALFKDAGNAHTFVCLMCGTKLSNLCRKENISNKHFAAVRNVDCEKV
ncbi:MAG: hypothetical protein FWH36_09020 [Lentimicrobiaceae bacterium]|nr:hypothetical protein [Lentimicrobiaceae bacterium]